MPRDSAGVMSLPPSTWATSGQTINVNQHNPAMREIEQALTDSLPRNGSAGMTAPLNMGGNQLKNVGAPVDAGDAVSLGFVGRFAPIGVILDYAGDNAPENWVFCFGQELNRTTEAGLFSIIGTKFGAGNGTTTFNLPDYRGRVGVGRDNMGGAGANRVTASGSGINGSSVGVSGGSETHKLSISEMPKHKMSGRTKLDGSHYHSAYISEPWTGSGYGNKFLGGGTGYDGKDGGKLVPPQGSEHTHEFESNEIGSDAAHQNMQPSIIVNKIIRVR